MKLSSKELISKPKCSTFSEAAQYFKKHNFPSYIDPKQKSSPYTLVKIKDQEYVFAPPENVGVLSIVKKKDVLHYNILFSANGIIKLEK